MAALLMLMATACAGRGIQIGAAPKPPTAEIAPAGEARYAAAKAEGGLTWYAAWYDLEQTEKVARLFEKTYPGVKVTILRLSSGKVYQRFLQESDAQQHIADVLSLADQSLAFDLKDRGDLTPFRPEGVEHLLPRYRNLDSDGYIYVGGVAHVVMAYNPRKVGKDSVPRTWSDLLEPRWRNKIAASHPAANGYASAWATALTKKYGDDYIGRFADQNVLVGQSIADPIPRVTSGERDIGVVGSSSAAIQMREGDPIRLVYPADGSVVIRSTLSIPKNAPHPNAARLFSDFIYGNAYQKDFVEKEEYAPFTDLSARPPYIPRQLKELDLTRDELLERLQRMIDLWRKEFGA
ncbi:extracellular solute-binding protein [Streptomyces shenzhenensis]|uniref:ABC transporter substrate-binding protein n=1 Tax=Streptomyces shenzhenensis TaxID=943815 RepID=UPI0033FC7A17